MSYELSDDCGKPHGCHADYCANCDLKDGCPHYDPDDTPYEDEEEETK